MDDYKYSSKKKFHFNNIYKENALIFGDFKLYQIGDLSCQSGYRIGEHKQCCHEITYIYSGEGTFYVNKKKYKVKRGDIIFTPFRCLHDGIADKESPFRFFYLGFNLKDNPEESAFTDIMTSFDTLTNPVCQGEMGIESKFMSIFNEIINLKDHSNIMIKICIEEIVLLSYRSFFDNFKISYEPAKFKTNSQKLAYEIVNYIDLNILNITELSAISEEFDYSYIYLSHIFKNETGMSISDYYNKRRFEVAIDWLSNTEKSITEISTQLNYKTIHAFSRAFKQRFGISPSEYKLINK